MIKYSMAIHGPPNPVIIDAGDSRPPAVWISQFEWPYEDLAGVTVNALVLVGPLVVWVKTFTPDF